MKKNVVIDNDKKVMPPSILPWLISGAFFMQMLDGTILNTALPEIAKSIGESPLEIQSIVVLYFLTAAALLPLSGWLADKIGSKKIFSLAIIIFTLGSVFCAMSDTLTELASSRVFQAIGGSMMVPVGRLIVIKTYPKNELMRIFSFIMLPALIGPLIGPVLGGFLVEYFSWHWIFLINIPIGVVCLVLTYYKMLDIREEKVPSFDWVGFVMFSVAIILFSIVLNDNKFFDISLNQKIAMGMAGVLFIAAYMVYAKYKVDPLFSLNLLKIRSFVVGALGSVFSRIGVGGLPYLSPLLLQVGLGYSPSKAGMIILTLGVAAIFAKSFVVRVVGFWGYRTFLVFNTLAMGALICCFALIDMTTPEWVIIALFFVLGSVNSMQFSAMSTLAVIDLPRKYASEGNSLITVVMQISVSIGVRVAAMLLNRFVDGKVSHEEVLEGFHYTALVIGIYTMICSVNFLFARTARRGD